MNKEANSKLLIEHYKEKIFDQTNRIEELKDIIRHRVKVESEEIKKRKKHNDLISYKLHDAGAKEFALLSRTQLLEEEVERLECALIQQREESEQKHLEDQIAMKESFEKDFETLRQKLVSNVYQEMGDVLSKTMQVNEELSCQLKTALTELESMELSLQDREKDLSFAKREIKLLKYKEKMMAQRRAEKAQARAYRLSKTQEGDEKKKVGDNVVEETRET